MSAVDDCASRSAAAGPGGTGRAAHDHDSWRLHTALAETLRIVDLTVPSTLVPADLAEDRREVFTAMVEAARAPGGRLVVIGEPGLGKSFLVDAVIRTVLPERIVLFVRGRADATSPYAGL
ncbi:MAG: hypothetical protein ACRYG2_13110, partial [Janthinobacterium lividum]